MEINEKSLDPEQQDPEKGKKKKKAKKSFWGEVREWAVSLLVAVVVVLFLQNFVFTLIRVDGQSMMTTLLDGERLFVTVADVKFGSISRDDVVICHYPETVTGYAGNHRSDRNQEGVDGRRTVYYLQDSP